MTVSHGWTNVGDAVESFALKLRLRDPMANTLAAAQPRG